MSDAKVLIAAAAITLAVTLGGCASDGERCANAGWTPGTYGFAQCTAELRASRAEAAAAASQALGAAAAVYRDSVTPRYDYLLVPQQQVCRSRMTPGGYVTVCD